MLVKMSNVRKAEDLFMKDLVEIIISDPERIRLEVEWWESDGVVIRAAN